MSVDLIPGYQINVQVKDINDNVLYQKKCTSPEQVKKFMNKYGKSKEGWSLLRGSVIPLRTDNLKDFSKDFFLPTFVNFSSRINNVALKIFASIFAIAFDIITFPVRVLTTPFRMYYNHRHPEEKHPVMDLIEQDPQSQKAIENDVVNLCYEVENVQISNPTPPDEAGHTFQDATKSAVKGTMQIALKKMPGDIKTQASEKKEDILYQRTNGAGGAGDGEWTVMISSFSNYYLQNGWTILQSL